MPTRHPRSSLWPKGQQSACSRRQFLGGALSAAAAAPLLATVARADTDSDDRRDNEQATDRAGRGNGWQGPRPTSTELGIDTPLPYLNDSWKVAADLVDRGRRLYHEGKGLGVTPDRPGGFPGAWLPISIGRRQPSVYPWDERDMRHTAKMMAYLWADENGLFEEFERNLFVQQIRSNGDFLTHDGDVSPYVQHVGMFMAGAADLGWHYGVTPRVQATILGNIVEARPAHASGFRPGRIGIAQRGRGQGLAFPRVLGNFFGRTLSFSRQL